MSPYCTAAAASSTVCCGGMPSITDDVAELEVAVDEHHRFGERFAIAAATLIAIAGLAHATLGREHDDQATGFAGTGRPSVGADGAGRRAGEELADPVDRLVQARLAADHDRVARAGPQRLLEHLGRQLVDREHRAQLRVRSREPVHVLEADRAHEAGAEHRDDRARRSSCWTSSSIVSNCAAPGELDREPRPQVARRARRPRRRSGTRSRSGASTVA